MNIVHLCLSGMITEGWTYQENMLIKYHQLMGHKVTVVTSQWIRNENGGVSKFEKTDYIGEYEARYIRLPIMNNDQIGNRFKRYRGLPEALEEANPDILFIHNFQFLDILKVTDFAKKHPEIRVYADNHNDFSNSARGFMSRYILHGVIWKYCAKRIEPFIRKFYGVLPVRVDFLETVYGFPKQKCELLIMGGDDEMVQRAAQPEVRSRIRAQYGIAEDDFLIVTGGKIDAFKTQTLLLMEAVQKLPHERVRLIVFGSVAQDLKERVETLADGKRVQYIGWVQATDSYDYFAAADLVVFPGRHSVFWEQVAAQGIPMLVKDWPGTHHVDLGGNVQFLREDSAGEIRLAIENLIAHPEVYQRMKSVAVEKGMKEFSYAAIAKRAIERE